MQNHCITQALNGNEAQLASGNRIFSNFLIIITIKICCKVVDACLPVFPVKISSHSIFTEEYQWVDREEVS